ncbi:MAG: endonuclease domain-containing protein [Rhizomicrobium sp.]|jgi:very-short-patch-repair endonuclease
MRDSKPKTVCRARVLRKRMTDAEVILWSRLRRGAAKGLHFRKQHPIGPYIADFACTQTHLVIEVDGGTHSTDAELEHDRKREFYLTSHGWRVFRVTNEDVYKRLDSVIEGIFLHMPEVSTPAKWGKCRA